MTVEKKRKKEKERKKERKKTKEKKEEQSLVLDTIKFWRSV